MFCMEINFSCTAQNKTNLRGVAMEHKYSVDMRTFLQSWEALNSIFPPSNQQLSKAESNHLQDLFKFGSTQSCVSPPPPPPPPTIKKS